MPVSSPVSQVRYVVGALGPSLGFPYYFLLATDLQVTATAAATGVDTLLLNGTDYSVSGAGVPTGGIVALEGSGLHYSVGDTVTISRVPALTQGTNNLDGVPTPAATLNAAFDALCMQVQELRDRLDRCLRLPISNPTTAAAEIALSGRKSALVGFDASGNLTNYAYPTTPGAATNLIVNMNVVGETGGGSSHLDGIDASTYPAGTVLRFNLGGLAAIAAGTPAPTQEYVLVLASLSTGDGVVAAYNKTGYQWVRTL
ncbi:MAG: hypothetical protein KGI89_17330 [Euryarchaeota archaeon]|nr:hypothetical protein [Euryarchaeota archaeon]